MAIPWPARGEGGRAIGLTTTASAIGTIISMLFVVSISPIISKFALQFTSFEFFLLAFFGILISGTLTAPDLVIKGWIAGFLGLFLACIGRDQLQFYPRFTFGIPELDSGIEVVPVLIGAFGIPQIIDVLRSKTQMAKAKKLQRILPEIGTVIRNIPAISDLPLSVSVSALSPASVRISPAGYPTAPPKTPPNIRRHSAKVNCKGVIASETANNACVGGAMIPLLNLGIPGSPPAAMLLGALMLHGVTPGPMITFEHPTFISRSCRHSAACLNGDVGYRYDSGQTGGEGSATSQPNCLCRLSACSVLSAPTRSA